MPVTTVDGSPALNVSAVSACHSTPRDVRMRSTTSCAVGGATAEPDRGPTAPRLHRQRRA